MNYRQHVEYQLSEYKLFGYEAMVSSTSKSRVDNQRIWQWLWLLPLIVAPVLWLGRFRSESAIADEVVAPLPVQTQVLELASEYQVERAYTGEVVARRSSDLGFEQSGTLVDVLVDEGDTVVAGAAIARLDTRSLQAQRQQLKAQLRQAQARFQELQSGPRQQDIAAAAAVVQDVQAQLNLANLQQVRREELYAQGAISLEERDQAVFGAEALESRLNQAKSQLDELNAGTRVEQVSAQDAQVEQIEASLKQLDVSITKSVIYAPFNGQVSLRLVDEGVVISPGQPIVRLVEDTALEARIGVPNPVANRLAMGSIQPIELNGQLFKGQVTALLPELDEASQTVTVVMSLPPEVQTSVGTIARLKLQDQQDEMGYWLPISALVAGERGLWSAYVLGESASETDKSLYEVRRREVEILYTESDRAFVRGLLQPGEKIITNGTHRLVPGQLVQN